MRGRAVSPVSTGTGQDQCSRSTEVAVKASKSSVRLLEKRLEAPAVIESYRANLAKLEAGEPIREP